MEADGTQNNNFGEIIRNELAAAKKTKNNTDLLNVLICSITSFVPF